MNGDPPVVYRPYETTAEVEPYETTVQVELEMTGDGEG